MRAAAQVLCLDREGKELVVARGRRAGSVNPDDEPTSAADGSPADADDVIDPLRIASDALEDGTAFEGPTL